MLEREKWIVTSHSTFTFGLNVVETLLDQKQFGHPEEKHNPPNSKKDLIIHKVPLRTSITTLPLFNPEE
jgi:hypothetical protein